MFTLDHVQQLSTLHILFQTPLTHNYFYFYNLNIYLFVHPPIQLLDHIAHQFPFISAH